MFGFLFTSFAFAVPVQLSQQGRLLDSNSIPVEGNHVLTVHLYDASVNGSFVWGENISVVFYNGFYQILLGSDISNPLDSDLLDQDVLYIEMQIDGNSPLQPRQKLTSVPYAKRADVAKNIDGGVVNATEISINGNVVLDSSGSFVGQSTPQWSDIQNIPSDFSDGVDNDSDSLADISCPSDDMILSYVGGTWMCGYDDVLATADVVGIVESESELTLTLHSDTTINGEMIQTGIDQDTLASLNCTSGQIPVLDPSTQIWSCGNDNDNMLTEQEVLDIVQASTSLTLALSSSSTLDGENILTENSSLDWNNLTNKPLGLDDGDDNDSLDDLNCSVGQIAIKGTNGWECKEFSSALDSDGDGALQWNDCDDTNADVGDQSNDNDCDGVAISDDCDDSDASNTSLGPIGSNENCAASSCKEILDTGVSTGDGNYWIDPSGSSAFEVLCDMTTDGGGWVVLANDDYSSAPCPGDWVKTEGDRCWRNNSDTSGSAMSSFYNTEGISFTEVRSSITALQYASMDAFGQSRGGFSIDDNYVDGFSLTLGEGTGNRSHLYSWAIGLYNLDSGTSCPAQGGESPQGFVGNEYSCETGNPDSSWTMQWYSNVLFSSDVASITLSTPSSNQIEGRLMSNQESAGNEDIGIRTFELRIR